MKKILLILMICATMDIVSAWAAPVAAPAIESVSSIPTVRGGEGRIYLSAGSVDATFNIYSITGQLVRVVKLGADTHTTVEMPKGFYVVRYFNQWSRKVVVK